MAGLLDHDVVAGLMRTLLFGVPLVAFVAVVARLIPGLPAAARVAAWWLVTLRLALWLVPVPTVPIAVLPAPEAQVAADTRPLRSPRSWRREVRQPVAVASAAVVPGSWDPAIAVAWGGGLVAIGLVSLLRLRRARAVVSGAGAAPDGLRLRATALASRMGLHRTPEVRVSTGIATPQVSGLLHPVILLPERAATALERDALDMVLCHELLHVRRRDLWLGLVPAAARLLLWFNPAAHLAAREYLLAREAACDAGVLDVLGVEPRRYGRLLLSFGASRAALGGAAASGSVATLKRRLMMLDSKTRSSRFRHAGWAMPACAAFALMPISFVARAAQVPHASTPHALTVDQAGEAPAPAAAAAASHAPAHAPAHAEAPQHSTIHVVDHDRTSWVLFEEGSDEVHMSGSTADVSAARAARRGREALLWMRRDDRRFAVRDKAAMDRVRALFEPMEQLGGRQAALGAQQAAIGAKMATVGQQQAEIGSKQAALGTKQAAIGARQAAEAAKVAGSPGKGVAPDEARMKELESQMEALGTQMDALGQQMEALSTPMEDLSKQMEPLAAQQEELGTEMEAIAERATEDLERFLDEAVRNGTAVEIK